MRPRTFGSGVTSLNGERKVKVRVYVDHLNFFWRVSRHYGKYWVDFESMLLELIKTKIPNAEIECLIIFTAMFLDEELAKKQELYFNVLRRVSKKIRIVKGYHKRLDNPGILIKERKVTNEWVRVQQIEEKQTDGNIVGTMVEDAYIASEQFDVAVLVSNDTDLAIALEIRNKLKLKTLLITPQPEASKYYKLKRIPRELRIHVMAANRIEYIPKLSLINNPLPERTGNLVNPGDATWFPKEQIY